MEDLFLTIKNDELVKVDRYGNGRGLICRNARCGMFSHDMKKVVVVRNDGIVQIHDFHGNPLQRICEDGLDARFSGEDIIVQRKNGRTELRDKYGNTKRTM